MNYLTFVRYYLLDILKCILAIYILFDFSNGYHFTIYHMILVTQHIALCGVKTS